MNCLNIPADIVQIIRNMYVYSKGISVDELSGELLEFLANIGVNKAMGPLLNCLHCFLIGYIPIYWHTFNVLTWMVQKEEHTL